MKTFIAATILLAACSATVAFAAEKKVKMEDLPPAVQQAIKDNTKDATLVSIDMDVENGKTEYEAQTKVNGHGKAITFDETGKLTGVEEEVAMDSIPAAAKAYIEKQAAGGTIKKVEKVTEGGKTFYEASIRKDGKKSEAQVLPDGTPTKED
ncbi:MAG TPA: PepSY-like domain-containing protein [Terriglobales bacterium]|jgi:uncharacterized membrane protein YkoI|nr:PepSY-like domain-containing protein [Terriglobales bacterium]